MQKGRRAISTHPKSDSPYHSDSLPVVIPKISRQFTIPWIRQVKYSVISLERQDKPKAPALRQACLHLPAGALIASAMFSTRITKPFVHSLSLSVPHFLISYDPRACFYLFVVGSGNTDIMTSPYSTFRQENKRFQTRY